MLEIKDLHVSVDGCDVLKGFNLSVKSGEIHAIMGPNGAGKSTLAKVCAGDETYSVDKGSISFNGVDLLELDPEERARLGLFMGFQYPVEIPGVTNLQFLYAAHKALKGENALSEDAFKLFALERMSAIKIDASFLKRDVNSGFSGGEKKKNEIIQLALLGPKCAILDETDSGLDIDAMKVVADGIKAQMSGDKSVILITHYQRLLDYIKPDFVHVVVDGRVVKSGDFALAGELESKGYEELN